jgi:hypothetical protein
MAFSHKSKISNHTLKRGTPLLRAHLLVSVFIQAADGRSKRRASAMPRIRTTLYIICITKTNRKTEQHMVNLRTPGPSPRGQGAGVKDGGKAGQLLRGSCWIAGADGREEIKNNQNWDMSQHDIELHADIIQAARNPVLSDTNNVMNGLLEKSRGVTGRSARPTENAAPSSSNCERDPAGKIQAVAAAMREHLHQVGESVSKNCMPAFIRGRRFEPGTFYEAPKNIIVAPGWSKDARISAVPASVITTLTFGLLDGETTLFFVK